MKKGLLVSLAALTLFACSKAEVQEPDASVPATKAIIDPSTVNVRYKQTDSGPWLDWYNLPGGYANYILSVTVPYKGGGEYTQVELYPFLYTGGSSSIYTDIITFGADTLRTQSTEVTTTMYVSPNTTSEVKTGYIAAWVDGYEVRQEFRQLLDTQGEKAFSVCGYTQVDTRNKVYLFPYPSWTLVTITCKGTTWWCASDLGALELSSTNNLYYSTPVSGGSTSGTYYIRLKNPSGIPDGSVFNVDFYSGIKSVNIGFVVD